MYTRLVQHKENSKFNKTFAGKYNCYYLIYWERHTFIEHAIEREKEIKGWTRQKKNNLIKSFNPKWDFLNDEI